ncbi:MAG: CYTH domain-containing protein [Candidatus Colwellbacteria bacterium]|nr:CYTH domain-containing protein [Candidatus Colwellbacteria bacterium]MBI3274089.1 CYTH domain-containing protein [Candidatus Colwellbacteria bacterium]
MNLSYEIEIKSLLGTKEIADALRARLLEAYPQMRLSSKSKQLNHYFTGGNLHDLAESITPPRLTPEKWGQLNNLAEHAQAFSVRTREKNNDVYLVVKASIDDATSENGTSRIELEERIDVPLNELDSLLLVSGFNYQAKWSREREEYSHGGITVCLDKNAGYGWIAEFEKMIDNIDETRAAQEELRSMMSNLGVYELPQEQLSRMFTYYNEHWEEYYGTDKTFAVQ